MSNASIQITDQRTAYDPGETVTGQVTWQLDSPPESAELRLVWSTRGRGITDYDIVQTVPFSDPQASETRPFTFTLPDAPYSFSGTLITLTWTLELEIEPGKVTDSTDIILAPGGKAISLPLIKSP